MNKKIEMDEGRVGETFENGIESQKVSIWQAAVLFGFFLFAFFPVWKGLVNAWSNSEDYSHAFLILPISLYLVWMKKQDLTKVSVCMSKVGFSLFLFFLSLYLFSFFAKISTVAAASMVLSLVALVWTLYGTQVTKLIAFPLFFLFLMVPIPSQIYSAATIPLQLFVSKVSTLIAAGFEIPVYREGNVLHLPERTLQVVEACSGLRSIISLFTLSLVLGYLALARNISRVFLAFFSLPVALLVNIVRVLIMLMAFHFFNIDLTSGTLHTYFGLMIFFLALVLLYFTARILSVWER